MKQTLKVLAVGLVAVGLLAAGAPAFSADEPPCPMGGTMVMIAVDKDKALDWAKDRRKAKVADERSDAWSVLTLAKSDDDIAIVVTSQYIFFGVAGRGREVDARDAEKVFGKDFRRLREAVQKELGDLWKERAVKLEGREVQQIAEAVGLGTLAKDRRDWELSADKCEGKEIDTSGL